MKKRKTKSQPISDHGPVEIQQHGEYHVMETTAAGVFAIRNTTHDPIETYFKRKNITRRQYAAADRLATQWRKAQLVAAYTTVSVDSIRAKGMSDQAAEIVTAAKQEVRAALRYVGDPLADVLVHVVGDGHPAGGWRGVVGDSRASQAGMIALRLALDGLAKYYRL
jgi:hypothetical protein|tara:strand:- start:13420 stop:13917 length:498 start_codon:yes stop_codon:yes gene_type:complete